MPNSEQVEQLLRLLSELEQEQAVKKDMVKAYNASIKELKERISAKRLEIQGEANEPQQ